MKINHGQPKTHVASSISRVGIKNLVRKLLLTLNGANLTNQPNIDSEQDMVDYTPLSWTTRWFLVAYSFHVLQVPPS